MAKNLAVRLYSIFVLILSAAFSLATLGQSLAVFLPGMLTVLTLMNVLISAGNLYVSQIEDASERLRVLYDSVVDGIIVHKNGFVTELSRCKSVLL